MGRTPAVPLELVPSVVELWDDNATIADIQKYLTSHGTTASERTIRTIVRAAGGKARVTSYTDLLHDTNLRIRITDLFYLEGLPDDRIVARLAEEGYDIKARTFVQLRKDMGMKLRLREGEFEERRKEYKQRIQEELDRSGIDAYGKTLLQTHFRTMDRTRLYLGK